MLAMNEGAGGVHIQWITEVRIILIYLMAALHGEKILMSVDRKLHARTNGS